MDEIKMGEYQSREIEKFFPIVKCAKLDKDCEGCQAAKRVLDINQHTNAMAVKKVKEQCKQIQQLQADKEELVEALDGVLRYKKNTGQLWSPEDEIGITVLNKHQDSTQDEP